MLSCRLCGQRAPIWLSIANSLKRWLPIRIALKINDKADTWVWLHDSFHDPFDSPWGEI